MILVKLLNIYYNISISFENKLKYFFETLKIIHINRWNQIKYFYFLNQNILGFLISLYCLVISNQYNINIRLILQDKKYIKDHR